MSVRKTNYINGFIFALVTLFLYAFTTYPATKAYSYFAIAFLMVYLVSIYLFRRKHTNQLIYSLILITLILVGITGWAYSPFFSYLYITAIALSFLFHPIVSGFFIIALIGIFIPNIGAVDIVADIQTLISFILIIPLTYFLRKHYLKLKENEKKILILEEKKDKFENKVEEVMSNKIVKLVTEVREPLNDIKQLSYYGWKDKKDKHGSQTKIIALSDKALEILKEFERETTNVKKPKTFIS